MKSYWRVLQLALAGLLLVACGTTPTKLTPNPVIVAPLAVPATPESSVALAAAETSGQVLLRGKSRWVATTWRELPGFETDALHEAWNAFLKSCERPGPVFAPLCPEVRRLSIGDAASQRAWLQERLQPYRVEPLQNMASAGLLTAYFEPEFEASRLPNAVFPVPMYQPPAGLSSGKTWFSRRDIDTLPDAQIALRGREIVYLADPVQALILQIQGSGRVRVIEPDGTQQLLRLAYAGNNGHSYQSIGRWLLDQGELRDASWPGIAAWLTQNPQRINEVLWKNPRVVFFREERLSDFDAGFGPRGAQGVALTPGRSIAVDPDSIPYGTPVWLASQGSTATLQRLVLAQDTGNAITGALRADYFVGWGTQAGELAGRLKQALQLWVLWPKRPG
jgi:membrane-bound lytic murein transglycosylase A